METTALTALNDASFDRDRALAELESDVDFLLGELAVNMSLRVDDENNCTFCGKESPLAAEESQGLDTCSILMDRLNVTQLALARLKFQHLFVDAMTSGNLDEYRLAAFNVWATNTGDWSGALAAIEEHIHEEDTWNEPEMKLWTREELENGDFQAHLENIAGSGEQGFDLEELLGWISDNFEDTDEEED